MFIDWGGGVVLRCSESGFTVNRGAVNRGFTVMLIVFNFVIKSCCYMPI